MVKIYKQYLDGDRKGTMKTQRLILKIRKTTKVGATVPIMHYVLKVNHTN